MQIDGWREFSARIMPAFPNTGELNQNTLSNMVLDNTDTFDISEIGKRMVYSRAENDARIIELTELAANKKADSADPIMNLMEDSISSMEEILKKMHKLAVKAANNDALSDMNRINMQIEMEDLREELKNAAPAMNIKLAQTAEARYDGSSVVLEWEADYREQFMPIDKRSMLERARDRIARGEEWDVKEGTRHVDNSGAVWSNDPSSRQLPDRVANYARTQDEDGNVILEIPEDESEYYVLSGRERFYEQHLSVRQRLEKAGAVILMDAKSAEKGVKRIEDEMEKLEAMKQEFNEFKAYVEQGGGVMDKTELSALNADYAKILKSVQDQKILGGLMTSKDLTVRDLTYADLEARAGGWNLDVTEVFMTEIGIVKTDKYGANPELVRPATEKGAMYAKLTRFFESVAGNLANKMNDKDYRLGSPYLNGAYREY